MIFSMTGFATNASQNSVFTVEIKSVNSKYLDINLKLPESIRYLEQTIRDKITQKILRGKLELQISKSNFAEEENSMIDIDIATKINDVYKKIKLMVPDMQAPTFKELYELSQTFKPKNIQNHDESLILGLIDELLEQFLDSRRREGSRLAQIMLDYVMKIESIRDQIVAKIPVITREVNEKLAIKIQNILEELNPKGIEGLSKDEINSRVALEVATLLVKGNINEELDRLQTHCHEIKSILSSDEASKSNQSNGKRLDFIYQEMNREINTIGSKSSDTSITNHVIDLKVLVDQLREQSLNLE
ncbi:YicC/YloC family endoribonuclease [Taylorella equigenitalis]|uniref:TIGR00255 family protein n=1 Tax=Taylorella equigenitalis ATCC 35865 TaxID=743973 RepID=A0ABN4AW19_9BURK|nr:YicC/YloC family endoribonuclease [Taylorella equigenitalis]AFN36136.1 hypothetical protein KUI_1071 [Taylorella equigenitalis ATCC 35865]ASY39544.1 YicC family protein [Taylorella equigenitalis]ASY41047.1 YicC family protein [Taylorella equigenitalis]VEG31832.1 YicC-like family, N-terminal region [Taylorella equigenitalis ATCC 35865]